PPCRDRPRPPGWAADHVTPCRSTEAPTERPTPLPMHRDGSASWVADPVTPRRAAEAPAEGLLTHAAQQSARRMAGSLSPAAQRERQLGRRARYPVPRRGSTGWVGTPSASPASD